MVRFFLIGLLLTLVRPAQAQVSPRVGVSVIGGLSSQYNAYNRFTQGGVGAELLVRLSGRLNLEARALYLRSLNGEDAYYRRSDVPVTVGLRVRLGRASWRLLPFLVWAVGGGFATLQLPDLREHAWFVDGQMGVGLQLRLYRVRLFTELRGTGRARVGGGSSWEETNAVGDTVPVMSHQLGVQGNLGLSLLF